jgi:hypothetical protein
MSVIGLCRRCAEEQSREQHRCDSREPNEHGCVPLPLSVLRIEHRTETLERFHGIVNRLARRGGVVCRQRRREEGDEFPETTSMAAWATTWSPSATKLISVRTSSGEGSTCI